MPGSGPDVLSPQIARCEMAPLPGQKSWSVMVSLPFQPAANGQPEQTREIQFTYQSINWDDHPHLATPFDSGQPKEVSSWPNSCRIGTSRTPNG